MSNEPEATVPAMDVERRAEQLYREFYNVPPVPGAAEAIWSELSTNGRQPWRLRAQSELAEEAKRRGDHDTLREMHGTLQTVTGAAAPAFAAITLGSPGIEALMEATDRLTQAVVDLVNKVFLIRLATPGPSPAELDDAEAAANTVKRLLISSAE